jgi:YVTN family beta-propeller protein
VNPTRNRIYVANAGSNTVSVIDGTTNTVVATVTVGTTPFGVAANPVTNRIYVTNAGSNTVSVIEDLPPGPPPCHEDDGNGNINGTNGGTANFKQDQDQCEDQTDNDQDQATDKADNIQFNDPGANVNFVSGRINSINFNGPAHSVTITGTGTNAGHVVSFTVVAVSTRFNPPGFFSISLSDGYVNSGNLLSGVIEVS